MNLAGISAGGGETQTLTVTAISGNPTLIPNPTVTYVSPNSVGSLNYKPVANVSGTALVTVTVSDGIDSTSQSFTATINAVNDAPVFTIGASRSHPFGTISFQSFTDGATGISDGDVEATQSLFFNVSNNNPSLCTVPPSMASDGTLTYTPNGSGAQQQ